jgi:hypothetical protein
VHHRRGKNGIIAHILVLASTLSPRPIPAAGMKLLGPTIASCS